MIELLENERIDDLNIKGYRIIQNKKDFCFGIDAVLLSDFAAANKGERVLDLCTGTGILPILMAAKTEAEHFSAIEIQKNSAELAQRSVAMNGLEERISIVNGDIKNAADYFACGSFDVITCNPPYMADGSGAKNLLTPKVIARHEVLCNIYDVMQTACKMLRYGGRMYLVHRPDRLVDIFQAARQHKVEPKRLRLVQPYADKPANLVLLELIRGGKPFLKTDAPLIIYKNDGEYTDEIKEIYGTNGC